MKKDHIQLPGHEVLVPNAVFCQPAKGYKRPSVDIKILQRFSDPTEDKVINAIVQAAQSVGRSEPHGAEPDTLEASLRELPPKILQAIAKGDEKIINYLRSQTPASRLPPGHAIHYFEVFFGILPKRAITLPPEERNVVGYNRALHEALKEGKEYISGGQIRISWHNDLLPSLEDLTILIKHGTTESITFRIVPPFYDKERLTQEMAMLYPILAKQYEKVFDASSMVFDSFALRPIIYLLKKVEGEMPKRPLFPTPTPLLDAGN